MKLLPLFRRPGIALPVVWSAWAALLGCAAVACADTLDDPLNDDQHLDSFVNLRFDNTNPQYFQGDTSRITRQADGNPARFVYHLPGIVGFRAAIYYWGQPGTVEVYASPDKVNWSQVGVALDGQTPTADTWCAATMIPSGALPDGTNYLEFAILSGEKSWTPQIGEVLIDFGAQSRAPAIPPALAPARSAPYSATPSPLAGRAGEGAYSAQPGDPGNDGPSLAIPGGFTAVAASDQASIAWMPVPGAVKYTIRRGMSGASNYQTVASDLTSGTFTDRGLKPGHGYWYQLVAIRADGTGAGTQTMSVTPDPGAVVFNDPLADWSLVSDRTDGLAFSALPGSVSTIRRTKADAESITYNLPGATRLTFAAFFKGDVNGQVAAEASTDSCTWTSVPLINTTPVTVGNGLSAAVFASSKPMPANTNYLRIDLLGTGCADTPSIGTVRAAYGATLGPSH
ncbi:MAG: hypothetical protein ACLQVD_18800 [Capsulimonadaceae bacterium]